MVVALFAVSLNSQLNPFVRIQCENRPRALLCMLWRSALWEFNTVRIVQCYPHALGLRPQRFLVSLGLLFRQTPHLRWAPVFGAAKKAGGVGSQAAKLPAQHWWEREMLTGFPWFVWMPALSSVKEIFIFTWKEKLFLSQNFLVKQQFLMSIVLYECSLFTHFLYAELWELCAKIARSKMSIVML